MQLNSLKRINHHNMNKKFSIKIAALLVVLAVVTGMTSCNRGYGCPYELKAAVSVVSCIK